MLYMIRIKVKNIYYTVDSLSEQLVSARQEPDIR